MACHSYEELKSHIGHKIECVQYGSPGDAPENVAVECVDCCEVILDFNKDGEGGEEVV